MHKNQLRNIYISDISNTPGLYQRTLQIRTVVCNFVTEYFH